jgi:hypothetical protein
MSTSQTRLSNGTRDGVAPPVVHWAAASSGATIGIVLSLVADSLWVAAAFSSHDSTFYNHLAWWLGGTLIGTTLIGGVIGAGLSNARGAKAGAVNGLTSGSLVVLVSAAAALVVAVANGTTTILAFKGSQVSVDLLRPYVAFWSSAAALTAAGVGGAAGGLIPRRKLADVVPLAVVPSSVPETVPTAAERQSDGSNVLEPVSGAAAKDPNGLQAVPSADDRRTNGSIAG